MFGKNKLKNYAENLGGYESMLSELIAELKTYGFFIEHSKSTKILLKQYADVGFNVIELVLISETEIRSSALRRERGIIIKKVYSLNNTSQREIATDIVNRM